MTWELTEDPSPDDIATLAAGVTHHGRTIAVGGAPTPIACFRRRAGEIIAGASGRTEYERLFVSYVWVREDVRRIGFGGQALAHLEAAALSRGCRDVILETLLVENLAFYLRRGYKQVAELPHYVGPFSRYFLHKALQ